MSLQCQVIHGMINTITHKYAFIVVNQTNISTVTNTQGEFLLKVPKKKYNSNVTISFLGYTSKVIKLTDLNKAKNIIKLETHIEELSEVQIITKDALSLVKEVFKRKSKRNHTEQ